ncbi:aminotransferase class V-fold PLP-dependent enzyme [candidate division KSB1 bacterium]
MQLSEYRKEFPILHNKNYLNSCSLGALSLRHREYTNEFLDLWDSMGASAWYEKWMGTIADVRDMFARVIGADPDEVALGHSVSTMLSTLSSSLSFEERSKVVMTDLDFPTANYQWLAKERIGVKSNIVISPDSIHLRLNDLLSAIDEETAVVSTSHVFFGSGFIQDIAAINAHAESKGALTIIDAYQSVGQVPVNVKTMNIDILMTGGLKWLLGGPGITYLYIRKDLISGLEPTAGGWFGVKEQFGFDQTQFEYHDNAQRFEAGTPAAAAIFAAKAGLEIVLEAGLENIQKTTKDLTEELVHELHKAGFTLRTADNREQRSAIVMIQHPEPAPVVAELANRGIIVDHRKDNIRVSPYFYNTSEDIQQFLREFKDIV